MSRVKIIVFLTVIVPITQAAATFCTKHDAHGAIVRYCCAGSKGDGWNCEFICDNCENGTCIGPEMCVCNEGFVKSAGPRSPCVHIESVPQPRLCSEHCHNGTCVEGICSCAPGWMLQEEENADVCVPQCVNIVANMSVGCVNSNCVAPGVCLCFEGYELLPNNEFECQQVVDDYIKRKLVEIWKHHFFIVISVGALFLLLLLGCCCRLCWQYQLISSRKSGKHLNNDCTEENCEPLV